jgi:hypothetical protein
MMSSGGSGNGFALRQPNQLQADRQANVISIKTLTLDARAYCEGPSVSRSPVVNYSPVPF